MSIFGKSFGGGRRAAPRTDAPLIAVITTLTESHSVLVVDVSATGVRLSGTELPKMGTDLVVTIAEVRAFGTVAWSEHGECGMTFDVPLSNADVERLKLRVSTARGLPPEIKAAFDNWVIGCGR